MFFLSLSLSLFIFWYSAFEVACEFLLFAWQRAFYEFSLVFPRELFESCSWLEADQFAAGAKYTRDDILHFQFRKSSRSERRSLLQLLLSTTIHLRSTPLSSRPSPVRDRRQIKNSVEHQIYMLAHTSVLYRKRSWPNTRILFELPCHFRHAITCAAKSYNWTHNDEKLSTLSSLYILVKENRTTIYSYFKV